MRTVITDNIQWLRPLLFLSLKLQQSNFYVWDGKDMKSNFYSKKEVQIVAYERYVTIKKNKSLYKQGMRSCCTAKPESVGLITILWQKGILFWYTQIRTPGDTRYSIISISFRNSTAAYNFFQITWTPNNSRPKTWVSSPQVCSSN